MRPRGEAWRLLPEDPLRSRLLAGGVRVPLVGRDVLLGALFGTSSTLLAAYMYLALPTLGFLPDRPPSVALATLLGAREVLGQILAMQREILTDPLYVLVVLLLLTLALRREWLAFGAAWFLFSVVGGALFGVQSPQTWPWSAQSWRPTCWFSCGSGSWP